jgi:hypothetical protein
LYAIILLDFKDLPLTLFGFAQALNHETEETTAHQVIPYVIPLLQAKGYNLVTVSGNQI